MSHCASNDSFELLSRLALTVLPAYRFITVTKWEKGEVN